MTCLPSSPHRPDARAPQPGCILSTELFGGHKALTIRHGGEDYRLRITAAGKLILTK